jgi:hypothetical protein
MAKLIQKIRKDDYHVGQTLRSLLMKLIVGLGYHLFGMMPSYQHICPPEFVSTNSTFGLSFSS